jgi:2-phospho-L-lactate guanylyltransferase
VNAWTLVIPVKALTAAKTRFAATVPTVRHAFARAFALDTIEAARTARSAARVLVVTGEIGLDADLAEGVDVRYERPGAGLAAAIETGITAARTGGDVAVAVLLGDLPALRPSGLDAALEAAARHPLSFVRDADGTGTTLATARAGTPFAPAFGDRSADRHREAGYADLVAAETSAITAGVRTDVDTLGGLQAALRLGVGPHTAETVAALAQCVPTSDPTTSPKRKAERDPHTRVQGIRGAVRAS